MDPVYPPIILASKSPRRSQLLEAAGIKFRVQPLELSEDFPDDLPVRDVARYIAEQKGEAARNLLTNDEEVVLTADSVVILDNQIFEKPADYTDAVRMLTQLSGRSHTVITGVCFISKHKKILTQGESTVYFHPLTRDEIDYYVRTFRPYDKAGAYAIQEWIGLCKIAKIEGTYSNIMGLPVDIVYSTLQEFLPEVEED